MPETDDTGRQPTAAVSLHLPGLGGLHHVLGPFARTGRYYTQAWSRYLGGQRVDLPIVRPTLALATQALLDEVIVTGFRTVRRLPQPEVFERIEREVAAALEFYERNGWLDHPGEFFAAPPPLSEVTVRQATDRGRTHERISFDSGYAPYPDEPGAERWLSYTANRREYALVLRHPEPRPWLVCVHGSEMGWAPLICCCSAPGISTKISA